MHISEKMKSVEIWAPKPCVPWEAAKSESNRDRMADCCERTGQDAGQYSLPQKKVYTFCRAEYSNLRGARWKVGALPHYATCF